MRLRALCQQARAIAPHILIIDKSGGKEGAFERAYFIHDPNFGATPMPVSEWKGYTKGI